MCNNNSKPIYYCNDCDKKLNAESKICPYCGSDKRSIRVIVNEVESIRVNWKARKFSKGIRQWVLEIIGGWFPSGDICKHPKGVENQG